MSRMNLQAKIILLLLAFALIPTALIGFSLWNATKQQEFQSLQVYRIFAEQLADSIDRNLFERYGDVQAFGLNAAVDLLDEQPERLTQAMNGYVEKYGLYPLMIFVDDKGEIIAANTRNADGEPIPTQQIIGENVADEEWFQRAKRGAFTERQPFTAPGNDQSTGTVIVDLYIDERVQRTNKGHRGAVLGFAAPVVRGGKTIGYWYNYADLATVEEIFEATYQRFKALGRGATTLTLLDADGKVLIDFDPAGSGNESVTETDAFMRLNLVSDNVSAAMQAVAGGTGATYSKNSRTGVETASGYSHLVGAMGYPGMNWSVLVRTPRSESAATPIAQRRLMVIETIIVVIIALIAGFLLGKRLSAPLVATARVARKIARGDLRQRVPVQSQDEIGEVGTAINEIADYLSETVGVINTGVENLEGTTQSMFGLIENVTSSTSDTNHRSRNVAAAAEEMSVTMSHVSEAAGQSNASLQSVASGADEMASTIREIAERTERARNITETAVGNVAHASDRVSELSKASDEISRVIDVILEIAEQTKLLALNATIEAARAGEAGKGFAVVASEVKDLAQETNKATEEIRDSINAIQSSTGMTVEEIGTIKNVIGEVSDIVSGIAAAVEEQSVTTNDMASNISNSAEVVAEMNGNFTEASRTAGEIASDISEVTRAIGEVDSAMAMVDESARGLAAMSEQLRHATEKFNL
jgi:methyl-accepting chemotaxis protein